MALLKARKLLIYYLKKLMANYEETLFTVLMLKYEAQVIAMINWLREHFDENPNEDRIMRVATDISKDESLMCGRTLKEELDSSVDGNEGNSNSSYGVEYINDYLRLADEQATNFVYHLIILDNSASMCKMKDEAVAGYNKTIAEIKEMQRKTPDEKHIVTVTVLSSTDYDYPEDTPVDEIGELKIEDYNTDDFTPLYDSVFHELCPISANTFSKYKEIYATIITDGYDNCSEGFGLRAVKGLIRERKSMGVKINYIGADLESEVYEQQMKSLKNLYAPKEVNELDKNEIYVFDTNRNGEHDKGEHSMTAIERFGAIKGQAEGLQGQSYAVPILNETEEKITAAIQRFVEYAKVHKELTFIVSPLGVDEEKCMWEPAVPQMLKDAAKMENVRLPSIFWEYL